MAAPDFWTVVVLLVIATHAVGIGMAMRALMFGRTAQGTVAWIISLALVPYVALPLYVIFGHGKFHGYIRARRSRHGRISAVMREVQPLRRIEPAFGPDELDGSLRALERIAGMPFTRGNQARILKNGDSTFDAVLAGIASARRYLLVQFYIINNDGIGKRLKAALLERAAAGVKVYVLYDEIGSDGLTHEYARDLRAGGVRISPFNGKLTWVARHIRINFRNHRKIVVADGEKAWVGGHNVSDEYLGRHPVLKPWRDTHVEVAGPCVLGCQLSFLEDWHWATGEVLDLQWQPDPTEGDIPVLVLPTGPADELESCGLAFGQMIGAARKRIWIANPYFVPDGHIVAALQLAALRGVDVRILLPGKTDNPLVRLAGLSYVAELRRAGIRVSIFTGGMLHQKVALFDDELSTIGTANFDYRSFRLNFEITLAFRDRGFADCVAEMLEADFADSRSLQVDAVASRSLGYRVAVQGARLMAPIL